MQGGVSLFGVGERELARILDGDLSQSAFGQKIMAEVIMSSWVASHCECATFAMQMNQQ